MRLACLTSAILLLATTTAHADVTEDEPETVFVRLGPDAPGAAVDVSFVRLETEEYWEADWVQQLDARVESVGARGFGGYAEVGAARYAGESALGNLDVGGMYRRADGDSALTARMGLVLPTMTEQGEDVDATFFVDASDTARQLEGTTTLRLATSPSWRWSSTVLRLDAGIDLPLSGQADEEPYNRVYVMPHFDVGIGYGAGPFGAALEVQLIGAITGDGGDGIPTVTASAQYRTSVVTAFVGASTMPIPLDSSHIAYSLNLGFRVPL
jgi:hypothetical protein